MMGFQFLGPILASVLYVMVFQKAGFKGPILAFCAAPVLGPVLSFGMMAGGGYGPGMMVLPLISIPLALLPLLILAFKPWPPVAAPNTRSEK